METFSALPAICAGNSPATGEFPTQRPATRSFDVFFDLRLNKRLSKQSWGWWFETPSRPLCCQCNETHQTNLFCWKYDRANNIKSIYASGEKNLSQLYTKFKHFLQRNLIQTAYTNSVYHQNKCQTWRHGHVHYQGFVNVVSDWLAAVCVSQSEARFENPSQLTWNWRENFWAHHPPDSLSGEGLRRGPTTFRGALDPLTWVNLCQHVDRGTLVTLSTILAAFFTCSRLSGLDSDCDSDTVAMVNAWPKIVLVSRIVSLSTRRRSSSSSEESASESLESLSCWNCLAFW